VKSSSVAAWVALSWFAAAGVASAAEIERIAPARAGRAALGLARQENEVVLSSCAASCTPEAPALRVAVPEAKGRAPTVQLWPLGDGESLVELRYALDGGRSYSLLVRAGHATEAPTLLVRGNTGAAAGFTLEVVGEGRQRQLLLTRRRPGGLCGRDSFAEVRRFDAERGEFVMARRPPFEDAERKKAEKIRAVTAPPLADDELVLRPWAKAESTPKAGLAVDGDTETKEREAWGELSFEVPAQTRLLELDLGVRSGAGSRLWLVVGSRLLEVDLPKATSHLAIPLEVTQPSCVALVSDAEPVALYEVSARAAHSGDRSNPALVRLLDDESAALLAQLALTAQGAAGAVAVSEGFRGLTVPGQGRALDLSAHFPAAQALDIELFALSSPNTQLRHTAEDRIVGRGSAAAPGLEASLAQAPPPEQLALLELLDRAAPDRLWPATVGRLAQPSSKGRAVARSFVSGLASEPRRLALLRAGLDDRAAPRRSRVELLRALTNELPRFSPEAGQSLLELLERPSFTESYALAEPWVKLAATDNEVRARLTASWTEPPSAWTPVQKAAFVVRLFELVADEPAALGSDHLAGLAKKTADPNVRVRRAATALLGGRGDASSVDVLLALLGREPWPLVREEALRSLGGLGARSKNVEPIDRGIEGALRDDESPVVRRAAARALRDLPNPHGLEALRKALDDDASYLVKTEAAQSLGRRCDGASLDTVAELAAKLDQPLEDGQIELSVAALGALVELGPPDLDERLAPLRKESLPGPLRGLIERTIEQAKAHACSAPPQGSAKTPR
jgi:hypothetical protein